LLVRKGGEADAAAAVGHVGGVVDRVRRARAFDDVIDAIAAGEPAHRLDRVLLAHVDHMVGAEFAADLQAIVARAGEDHGARAERLGDGDAEQPDGAGPEYRDALAGDEAAEFGQPVHGGAGGHHQGRLLVRHAVGDGDERVDVVDLIFAEAAIGGEAVGAVALVHVAVVEAVVVARGVHALAAALALAAAGVNLHRHALADGVFV